MRKYFAIVLVVGVFAYLLGLASCGDYKTGTSSASISFVNTDETITDGCGSGVVCNNAGVWDYRWVKVLVTDSAARTGATSDTVTDSPISDVEVSFTTWPIENDKLYLVGDNRNSLPPLVQPYTMRTDVHGTAELVWMFQYPSLCSGTEVTHWLQATVGSAQATLTMGVTCESASGDDTGE